jgi:tripartite-type tricarboxylate transporter receptor subunit TctC
MTSRRFSAGLGLLLPPAAIGRAETDPSRPIHVVVPYAAGGARFIAREVAKGARVAHDHHITPTE